MHASRAATSTAARAIGCSSETCHENVECFRNRMNELGLPPDDVHGIEDLSKLPFSYQNDLRANGFDDTKANEFYRI